MSMYYLYHEQNIFKSTHHALSLQVLNNTQYCMPIHVGQSLNTRYTKGIIPLGGGGSDPISHTNSQMPIFILNSTIPKL